MIHIHRHRKTADATPDPKQRESLLRDFLIKTETKNRSDAESYLVAKRWDLDMAVRAWERADRTHDLAIDKNGKPATAMEQRNCIMEVARQSDCTVSTAENYLCMNDWNVSAAVSDLKRDRTSGFVIDSVRDGKASYAKDATYWNIYIDGKVYKYEDTEAKANSEADKLRKDPAHKGKTITVKQTGANTESIKGTAPARIFGKQ